MKTFKITLMALFGFLVPMLSIAQNQTIWVHDDHVKPGKFQEFKKIALEYAEACRKYNVKGADYDLLRMDDGTCRWASVIPNMAALDANPYAEMIEKMGKAKYDDLHARFDKCYDTHNSYIVHYMSDLSYAEPKGSPENKYAKFHYLYVKADQDKTVAAKIKALKELYAKKGAKEYFEIYHSGLGCAEEFYCAVIWAKDETSYITQSDENEKMLGEEGKKIFDDLMNSVNRYEAHSAWTLTDLNYRAKK